MPGFRIPGRSGLKLAAIVLGGVLAAVESGSAIPGPATITSYSFTGACGDCTTVPVDSPRSGAPGDSFNGICNNCMGTGTGLLTLRNYTLGNALSLGNFVSLSYSSNLTSFSITSVTNFSGMLPTMLPAPASVIIIGSSNEFISSTNGNWCAGSMCRDDFGTNGIWNAASAATAPALSTPALIALGLLLALWGWILLKRVPARSSASIER